MLTLHIFFCCFAVSCNPSSFQVLSQVENRYLFCRRDVLGKFHPWNYINAFQPWQKQPRNQRGSCKNRCAPEKENSLAFLTVCFSSCQTSSQLSRGPPGARGVLHAFSPSPKLQNAASAAALGSRPGKHAERPAGKGSAAWKKTAINTGRFSAQVCLFLMLA